MKKLFTLITLLMFTVVSHIGEVHVPKDFGKIMGMFSKDVLEKNGYNNNKYSQETRLVL